MAGKTVIRVKDLYKVYRVGDSKVKALNGVDFTIQKGEFCSIVGTSGSGKSTVARCLMNIYQPANGEIWYKDVNICDKKEFQKNILVILSLQVK